jgi:hypothetical protein
MRTVQKQAGSDERLDLARLAVAAGLTTTEAPA